MLYDELLEKNTKISVVGMGYVGMPIAISFATKLKVIGFDLNSNKINIYKSGVDPTNEVGDEAIRNTSVEFTSEEKNLGRLNFILLLFLLP